MVSEPEKWVDDFADAGKLCFLIFYHKIELQTEKKKTFEFIFVFLFAKQERVRLRFILKLQKMHQVYVIKFDLKE
jgi:hypothetical protein